MPKRSTSVARYSRSAAKRTRFSTATRKSRTNYVRKIWPYSTGMSLVWDPFPAKATAILRYSEAVVLTPSAGVPASYLWRANGIQDPNFSGIGHQPYGHDTYASIYNHYNVREAKITMTPTDSLDGIYGISLTDDSTVQTDYNTIRETKGTSMSTLSSSGGTLKSVTKYFNVNQNFDLPFQKSTSASFGANPSESMIFHTWYEGSNSATTPTACSFLFTISYVVDMWELKDLGQS